MTGRSFCRTLLACYNGRWGITVSEIGKKDLLTFQDIAKPIEQQTKRKQINVERKVTGRDRQMGVDEKTYILVVSSLSRSLRKSFSRTDSFDRRILFSDCLSDSSFLILPATRGLSVLYIVIVFLNTVSFSVITTFGVTRNPAWKSMLLPISITTATTSVQLLPVAFKERVVGDIRNRKLRVLFRCSMWDGGKKTKDRCVYSAT